MSDLIQIANLAHGNPSNIVAITFPAGAAWFMAGSLPQHLSDLEEELSTEPLKVNLRDNGVSAYIANAKVEFNNRSRLVSYAPPAPVIVTTANLFRCPPYPDGVTLRTSSPTLTLHYANGRDETVQLKMAPYQAQDTPYPSAAFRGNAPDFLNRFFGGSFSEKRYG